jgi:hypothetical protein
MTLGAKKSDQVFYPDNDENQLYNYFGGTSAAAPAAAGVIAALIGTVREQNGEILAVEDIRFLVNYTGTVIRDNPKPIGNRPDLVQLLETQGLPDGLLITQQGAVGGSFTYVLGKAEWGGASYELRMSPQRSSEDIGLNRNILIDHDSSVVVARGVLPPATALVTGEVSIANTAALAGQSYYLQAAVLQSGHDTYLTNSVEAWIRLALPPTTCSPPYQCQ